MIEEKGAYFVSIVGNACGPMQASDKANGRGGWQCACTDTAGIVMQHSGRTRGVASAPRYPRNRTDASAHCVRAIRAQDRVWA